MHIADEHYDGVRMRIAESPEIRTFEDLKCWRKCRELRIFVAKQVVPTLPKHERYRLGAQLLDAARSTTANIAEGYGRFHYLDNAKFCSNSRGSCWEVLDHLITAEDEGLLPADLMARGKIFVHEAVKWLHELLAARSDRPQITIN